MAAKDPARSWAAVELLAMTLLILSYIWLWQDSFRGDFAVCVGLFAALGFAAHRRRGESAREIGFRLDNLARSMLEALLVIGPFVLLPFVLGALLGTLNFPDAALWPENVVKRFAWGTAQQYGLLAIYLRRFEECVGRGGGSLIAAASFFALFHLPNLFLTAATLIAGALSCWLYRRVPNLWVLGLAHALVSFSLYGSIPPEVSGGMRVGPGYWRFWERIGASLL